MRAAAVVAFPLLVLVFWSFGDRLARVLGLRGGSSAEDFGLAIALSYGTVTLVVFLLAVAHAVTFGSILAVAAAMAALSLKGSGEKARGVIAWFRESRWKEILPPRAGLKGWLAALVILFYFLGLLVAMAPPTGIDA